MIIVAGFALVMLTVPLAGGRLAAMTTLHLRGAWLLVVALVAQTMLVTVLAHRLDGAVGQALHLATYALAVIFFIVNRRIRGLVVVGIGGASNLAAIVANGGVMPASAWAERTSGLVTASDAFANSRVVTGAHLSFLGDVFAVPARWPLANVFSIGDVVLLAGALYTAHLACSTRWVRRSGLEPVGATD
ncbi:MAG TPA: DUF5317 domain-containing protein [Ilumatobacteraceae bacterium]